MTRKLCKKCGVEKPLAEMRKSGSCKDGVLNTCNKCNAAMVNEWRKQHLEFVRERKKQAYADNRFVFLIHHQLQRLANLERYREKDRARYWRDRDSRLAAVCERQKEKVSRLDSSYVRRLICDAYPLLKGADMPETLINGKRQLILNQRLLEESQ